jgi:gamma-glutamylcyclotransferase (GGCT)/AIG2-like uncharacterized protein YtfP
MALVIVYGSLLSGFGNHRILADGEAKLLGEDIISIPYGMVSYGGFPALVPSKENHDIHVEVYECDERTYKRVEMLEGFPHFYQKFKTDTKFGRGEVYVINREIPFERQDENIKIDDGSWKSWKKASKPYYV